MSARISDSALRAAVAEAQWYHTIELRPGIETPGWFDLRETADRIPLPPSLEGERCLDVGTFDGFWAFEMERRGAEQVVAIDILDPRQWDWPANSSDEVVAAIGRRKRGGEGFEIAHRELDSSVERIELSVHDLDPGVHGRFDRIYVGSLLLHLRDPVGALMKVASVSLGSVVVCDAVDATPRLRTSRPLAQLDAAGRPWWWKPNAAALERMVLAAGFELVEPTRRLRMPAGPGYTRIPIRPATLRNRAAREQVFHARLGDPHAIVHARPAS